LLPVARKKNRLRQRLQRQPLLQPLRPSPHRQHLPLTLHLQHLQHLLLKKRKKKRSNSSLLDQKAGAPSAGFFSPESSGRAPVEARLLIGNHQ
jgi:hypothetical protein